MKNLNIYILILTIFISSFFEISIQKSSFITQIPQISIVLNSAHAGYDSGQCDLKKKICENIDQQYSQCTKDAGNDPEKIQKCDDIATDLARGSDSMTESIEEDMQDFENITSVAGQSMTQIFVTLLIEVVSAIIAGTDYRPSLLLHLIGGSLAFIAFCVNFFIMRSRIKNQIGEYCRKSNISNEACDAHGNLVKDSNELLADNIYAGDLTVIKTSNDESTKFQEDAIQLQIDLINENKKYLENGAMISTIAGGITATAAIIAVIEAYYGSEYLPNKNHQKWYTQIFNLLILPSFSQDEPTSENQGGGGSWITTGLPIAANALLGIPKGAAPEIIRNLTEKTIGTVTTKKISYVKIAALVLSAANFFYIGYRLKQSTNGYQDRLNALELLKTKIRYELGSTSTTAQGAAATPGQTEGGLNFGSGDVNDFGAGNCIDGSINSGDISEDLGCKTSNTATFKLPKYNSVGNLGGFNTEGLSTDPIDYAKATTDFANGKGLAAFNGTGATNSALGKKVLGKVLKKLRTDKNFIKDSPINFDQALAEAKKSRQELANQLTNALPKSKFDVLTNEIAKEDESKSTNVSKVKDKTNELEIPQMPVIQDPGLNDSEPEDGIHAGKLAEINEEEFSNLEIKDDDINKNNSVNIFKVIETRYKKSAYPQFFNKKPAPQGK